MGWEHDAVNEIARLLGAKVEWKSGSWETMIQAVREGQFDVGMDGITITEERKKQIDFSVPYILSQQLMLVRSNENRFKNEKEFANNPKLLIGAQSGTTNFYTAVYSVLDGDEKNPRIKLFEGFGAAVQALVAGDVDLVLSDAVNGKGYSGPSKNKLKLIGKPLGNEEFGFIFTPGSPLVKEFNDIIAKLKKNGFLDKLDKKWFVDYKP